jgi:mannose-binding lectin 2
LQLELRYKSEDEWTSCFETGPITLPSVSYLGFSGETGELSDNFDIVSVETKNLYQVNPSSSTGSSKPTYQNSGGKGRKPTESSGGWGWFFVKVFLFLGVCAGGYVGYTTYRAKNRGYSRFD